MLSDVDAFFDYPQFQMPTEIKTPLLYSTLVDLTRWHQEHCRSYDKFAHVMSTDSATTIADLPYLPVASFKTHDLKSVADDAVFKTMTSSGTTGQQVSRIYLDRETAQLQSRALTAIMTSILGQRRLPMLIIDTPNVVKDRTMFSARGAGVLGMMPFGRKHTYALNEDMSLNIDKVRDFCEKYGQERVLIFGFTFMVWKYFLQQVLASKAEFSLPQATLIHSGGWKKLVDEAVDNEVFKEQFALQLDIRDIRNFYGMVEQTGSIFVEGKDGFLYAPNFSDVIIRDPHTLLPVPDGEVGVIEVLSVLPRSYPGHILLTEDLGVLEPATANPDDWIGKRLLVKGRIPKAEIRGCSDTHAYDRGQ